MSGSTRTGGQVQTVSIISFALNLIGGFGGGVASRLVLRAVALSSAALFDEKSALGVGIVVQPASSRLIAIGVDVDIVRYFKHFPFARKLSFWRSNTATSS
jgi:hypothetical protein